MDELSTSDRTSQSGKPLAITSPVNAIQTTMEQFLSAASVDAVYQPPVHEGEHTVIPAAEVLSLAGFGLGSGSGSQDPDEPERPVAGESGGGGGGGQVFSRPVAAIVISPSGVRVEPIVDVTKIVLAVFTTLGFMTAMLTRMGNKKPPKFQ
jgi:uncharacterized spore protein YtfJ